MQILLAEKEMLLKTHTGTSIPSRMLKRKKRILYDIDKLMYSFRFAFILSKLDTILLSLTKNILTQHFVVYNTNMKNMSTFM